MKHKSLAMANFCLLLSACETMPLIPQQKTQARFEQDRMNDQLKSGQPIFKSCIEGLKSNTNVYKIFYEDIFFEAKESSNKYSLMMKKDKLTNSQIEFLKEAFPVVTKCRQISISALSGTPYQITLLKYYNAIDSVYIKLLKSEITIGEANEEKAKYMAQQEIDWSNASAELNSLWAAMDKSEREGRRQSAAAMLPYMMQQQQNRQNQQIQQQFLYQQQLQNIIKTPPILTSPTSTNCTTFGNQTNCTTH